MTNRNGYSFLEIFVASAVLLVVLAPLIQAYLVGTRATTADHSAAMLSALVAAERIRYDLEQLTHPDGPDLDIDGNRAPGCIVSQPGPDEGTQISFWAPAPRPDGQPVPDILPLESIRYSLEPIVGTGAFRLVRRHGTKTDLISGVLLRRLWFEPVYGQSSSSSELPGEVDIALEGEFDMMRVTITGVGEALPDEAYDRPGARQAQSFTTSFVVPTSPPSLVNRLRSPDAGDHYRFVRTVGTLD